MSQTPEQRARQREYQQRWRAANPDKVLEYGRAWRARHPEQSNANSERWRKENPERARAARKAYLAANADKLREQARARRALKPSGDPAARRVEALKRYHAMTPGEWQAMWVAQDGRCYLCEKPMDASRMISIDHDHRCCQQGSCAACRRGLVHQKCNTLVGVAGDDPVMLRKIADNLEAASAAAGARIAR